MMAETRVNEIATTNDYRYDFFKGTPVRQVITCMMMTTLPSTDQNTSSSSSTNKQRKRIVYCSSSDDEVVPPDFVSNSTPSQINYGPAGLAQSFGVTAEKKILPLEVL